MIPVAAPGGEYSVLLTKVGELDASHYVDPQGEQVLTVDHINTTCTGSRPFGAGESKFSGSAGAPFRVSLNEHIQSYVKDHFAQGTATVYALTEGSAVTLTVCIGATKTSPRNFWSGRWRSTWTAVIHPGRASDVTLKGSIKVQAHFYEEGNVQLAGDTEKTAQVSGVGADAAASAAAIAAAITKMEDEYQNGLETVFLNLKAFQSLRRKLPIHAEKFNWDQVGQHRIASQLQQGGGKK
jgi:capping protein alpha